MNRTLEDFIDSSTGAQAVAEVGGLFHAATASLGFHSSAFGRYRSNAVTDFYWDELPDNFAKTYCEQRWDRCDPLLARATQTGRAFAWSAHDVDAGLTSPQRDFFAELRKRGVRHGVTTPLHGPNGSLDLCWCITNEADRIDARIIAVIQGLALQAWLRCAELTPSSPTTAATLSMRESECLQWLREAKSNWEISQILKISEKTVEFHVGNLLRKLSADNRLAAVLIGIQQGLVAL